MSRLTRQLFGETALYPKLKALGHYPDYFWWLARGKPARTPHLVKQRTVAEYAERYRLRTLVETGTYYGEMVAAMLDRFDQICSIEFDPQLAALARRRFESHTHVRVLEGDSERLIPELLADITEPCLFWLDAGYYGFADQTSNTGRLASELNAILSHRIQEHVILLDDARGLTGADGRYTASQLISEVEHRFPTRKAQVSVDILRITPK
jgi:hypothetical protein